MRYSAPILMTVALIASGCGGVQPSQKYYETTTMKHEPVAAKHRAVLVKAVQGVARKGLLKQRKRGGQTQTLNAKQVSKLGLASLRAIQIMSAASRQGGEVDLMVSVKGKGRVPVSVTVDLKGRITFEASPGAKPPPGRKVRMPRFKNGNAKWNESHKRALVLAISQLSPAEAKVLKGMALIRYKRAKGDGNKGALYVQKNCAAEIRIYNRAFEADRWQFVGSAHRPLPSSTRTVLHEIGHGIHNRPSRVAFCAYEKLAKPLKARIAAYNRTLKKARKRNNRSAAKKLNAELKVIEKMKSQVKRASERAVRMAKGGPVLDAYIRIIGNNPAPTAYGRTSQRESFAESYSLFRSDPAALKRLLPRVHRWFADSGHIKAMP